MWLRYAHRTVYSPYMPIRKRLYRSRDDRIIAGVFGGLGEYFDIDPVILRLAYIVLLVVTAFVPGVIIYILAIFVMPLSPLMHADYEHSDSLSTTSESTKTDSARGEPASRPNRGGDNDTRDPEQTVSETTSHTAAEKSSEVPSSRRDDPLW